MILEQLQLRNYPYNSRKGLSERLVRQHFVKKGFQVFRGSIVFSKESSLSYCQWNSVKEKYDRMESVLQSRLGDSFHRIKEFVDINQGVPDYFVYKQTSSGDVMMFVEVKLEHEQVKPNQYACMQLLEQEGFHVRILRLRSRLFRTHSSVQLELDESSGKRVVKKISQSRQCRLTKQFVRKARKSR